MKHSSEVMKREPVNIEAALSCAIKLEAYEQSLVHQGALTNTLTSEERWAKRWSRMVYAASDQSDTGENATIQKRMDEL